MPVGGERAQRHQGVLEGLEQLGGVRGLEDHGAAVLVVGEGQARRGPGRGEGPELELDGLLFQGPGRDVLDGEAVRREVCREEVADAKKSWRRRR